MKHVPKNCGINERIMSEILSSIKKDGVRLKKCVALDFTVISY